MKNIKRPGEILQPMVPYLTDQPLTEIFLNRGSGFANGDEGNGPKTTPKLPRPSPSPATV